MLMERVTELEREVRGFWFRTLVKKDSALAVSFKFSKIIQDNYGQSFCKCLPL